MTNVELTENLEARPPQRNHGAARHLLQMPLGSITE
jgi:hypothetical protein